MLAGGFMLVAAGTFAAVPIATALGVPKFAVGLLILREAGRYREHTGEGKLSQHYEVTIGPDQDIAGSFIYELSPFFGELRPHIGKTFKFSDSEHVSVLKLVDAVEHNTFYRKLKKWLHKAQDTSRESIPEEIALCLIHLRATVAPLADYLYHHDRGRVCRVA